MTRRASQTPLFARAPLTALGIDPGSRVCGWAVVRRQGRQIERVASGELRPATGRSLEFRLAFIEDRLLKFIDEHRPDVAGLETQFVPQPRAGMTQQQARKVAGQQQAAIIVAAARGAAAVAIGKCELRLGERLRLVELAPATVKAAVCSGRADKDQVQRAVRAILQLGQQPLGTDESDALAIAIAAALRGRQCIAALQRRR